MSVTHKPSHTPLAEPSGTACRRIAIIGGGPAGLMAAEVIALGGHSGSVEINVFDAMPSVGRKFLMAGRGGLNITHSEPYTDTAFLSRYGPAIPSLKPMLDTFPPQELRDWVHGLGIATFVGSSGRVFPMEMKAAPMLRAWLHRLRGLGVKFHVRHRWLGWNSAGQLRFATPEGEAHSGFDAVVLALGGGSWAKLGSDGTWVPLLRAQGVEVAPLLPANCGFDVAWTPLLRDKYAGKPLKSVVASCTDTYGVIHRKKGECVISESGIEGGLIYALSAPLRDRLLADGEAILTLDLLPDRSEEWLLAEIAHPRGSRSLSSHLQSRASISGLKAALLYEFTGKDALTRPERLAAAVKALPVRLIATRPMDEAISTAGGVTFDALDGKLMVRNQPGLFCCGEMLDWDAPTGGYLLTACLATGRWAGKGVLSFIRA